MVECDYVGVNAKNVRSPFVLFGEDPIKYDDKSKISKERAADRKQSTPNDGTSGLQYEASGIPDQAQNHQFLKGQNTYLPSHLAVSNQASGLSIFPLTGKPDIIYNQPASFQLQQPSTPLKEVHLIIPNKKVTDPIPTKPQDVYEPYQKKLVKLCKDRQESIKAQRSVLEKLGIHMKDIEFSDQRLKRLAKMKDLGVRLEEVSLDLDKRYEAMFVNFNNLMENLKTHVLHILNEQKKEIFSTLSNEKAQNIMNLHSLENRLSEAIYISSLESNRLAHKEVSLSAFKIFFRFSQEFKSEFLDMVTSRMAAYNQKDLLNETSKYFNQQLSQSLVAPKAFPSELFRFFEHSASKPPISSHPMSGSFVNARSKFPSEMHVDLSPNSFPLNMQKHPRKGRDSGRAYVLFSWVDSRTLVMASEKIIRIVRLDGTNQMGYLAFEDAAHAADDVNIITLWEGKVAVVEESEEEFSIQCLTVAKFDEKTVVVIGGKDAVFLVITQTIHLLNILWKDKDRMEVTPGGRLDLKKSSKIIGQKVTTINQYKASNLCIATTTFGFLIVVNLAKMEVTNTLRAHKGIHYGLTRKHIQCLLCRRVRTLRNSFGFIY